MKNVEKLQELINQSENIVFFGGAGVSTESKIPDFRSVDGLYHTHYDYPPETILSRSFYNKKKEEFFRFYKDKMIYLDAKPNEAHKKLANLEQKGKLKAVITQNIDGLHQMAGSKNVLELHGSIYRNYCEVCGTFYPLSHICNAEKIPLCTCGGAVKPDVVLYEEGLNEETIQKAIYEIQAADLLIVGGTSLTVYPASGLIDYYRGKNLVLINQEVTNKDQAANYIFRDPIGELFSKIQSI